MQFVQLASSVSVLGVFSNHCSSVMWNREFSSSFVSTLSTQLRNFMTWLKKPFKMKTWV